MIDTLNDGFNTHSFSGVSFSEKGARAAAGGYLEYRFTEPIDTFFVFCENGKFSEDFSVLVSDDGETYANVSESNGFGTYTCETGDYGVYRFKAFAPSARYVKVVIKNSASYIKNIIANLDFSGGKAASVLATYYGEQKAANSKRISQDAFDAYKDLYLKNLISGASGGAALLASMKSDGSWSDLTYSASSNAYEHMTRCKTIALSLANSAGSLSDYPEELSRLDKAVMYYHNKNLKYSGWYYNHITVPDCYGAILLAAGESLSSGTVSAVKTYLNAKREYLNSVYTFTGANEIEISEWMIMYALFDNDAQSLKVSFDRIADEILVVNKLDANYDARKVYIDGEYSSTPGIQTDYSGVFHESQLYSGGYCLTLARKVSLLLEVAAKAGVLSGLYLEDYIDQILEHYRWIHYMNLVDFNTVGRYIAQNTSNATSNSGSTLKSTVQRLAAMDGIYRGEELKAYAALCSKSATKSYAEGNRYFYKPYYMVSQKGDSMVGLRMSSMRVNSTEQVGMCNLKGTYLADGCTYIYRTGAEYSDIFAAWDWCKIPGTTSLLAPFNPPVVQDYKTPGSASDLAGGASDGSRGVAAMQLVRNGLRAKKAWFMFDNEIVCLGSDISNSSAYGAVTTVNQCISSDTPVFSRNGVAAALTDAAVHSYSDVDYVLNDSIGYVFPKNGSLSFDCAVKTGDRYDINYNGSYTRPSLTDPVSKRIFSLWLDQSGAESYEYIIVPGATGGVLENYLTDCPVEVLCNDSRVQAVAAPSLGTTQYVFWESGEYGGIGVDAPCVICVKDTENGCEITLAALSYQETALNLTVNRELKGHGAVYRDNQSHISVKLPRGEYAGKSLTLSF